MPGEPAEKVQPAGRFACLKHDASEACFCYNRACPDRKNQRLNMTANPLSPSCIGRSLAMRPHDGRMPGMSVLIAYIVSCCLGLTGSATRASEGAKPTDDPSRKFFGQYCQACHTGAQPKGDFRF